MADVQITINDAQGRLAALPLLAETIRAAIEHLDRYVAFGGTIDVVVNADASGRFAASGDTIVVAPREGRTTFEAALASESRTGVDPHPQAADVLFVIDAQSAFAANLWWDPAIGSTLGGRVPDDRVDAFSALLRELLHALGVAGFRNLDTGMLVGEVQTLWDAGVTLAPGEAYYAGPAALALTGRPVELRLGGAEGAYHFGAGTSPAASRMPWLEASVLAGWGLAPGERYTLGRLELAVLQDLGWTIEPNTLVDVVNRWDARAAPLYLVGHDAGEQLAGGALGDRIEGRGGDDAIAGAGGDDTLDGGAGNDALAGGSGDDALAGGSGDDALDGGAGSDTAVYAGPSSAYTVSETAQGFAVGGAEGNDTLLGVEFARFSDLTSSLRLLVPNSPPVGSVQLSGTPRTGLLLLASAQLSDVDGIGAFGWRWQASVDGAAWSNIAGATAPGFTPGEAQAGQRLRVVVEYTDARGKLESVPSAATAPVLLRRAGSEGADTLAGSAAAEAIDALGGNDLVGGGDGDDLIDGGAGIDTAAYALARSSYGIVFLSPNHYVRADVGGEGLDTLSNVERLRFADAAVALDLAGHAGTTVRLLCALFGPASVANEAWVGIGLALLDGGMSDLALAQAALDARLGAAASPADVVRTLYANLTGADIGAADLARYTSLLAGGAYTPAALALEAARSFHVDARIDLVGLAAAGVEYTPA